MTVCASALQRGCGFRLMADVGLWIGEMMVGKHGGSNGVEPAAELQREEGGVEATMGEGGVGMMRTTSTA